MIAATISTWLLRVPVSSATPTLCTTHENTVGTDAEPLDSLVEVGIRHRLRAIKAVEGDHGSDATMSACATLRYVYKLTFEQALPFLIEWSEEYASPPWTEDELRRKLLDCYNGQGKRTLKQINLNLVALQNLAGLGITTTTLERLSPCPLDDQHPTRFLRHLFLPNALLVVGLTKFCNVALSLEQWLVRKDLTKRQFIVPNIALSESAMTQGGKTPPHLSGKAKSNFGPRTWLVTEFDFDKPIFADAVRRAGSMQNLCASVIINLMVLGKLRLVMVVDSAGKSLHAWWDCRGQKPEDIERFFETAVTLGADRATRRLSQFVRLPGGLRDGTKRQRVIFFDEQSNPAPTA